MYEDFIKLVRDIYRTDENIPLHQPHLKGKELEYLKDCIDTNYVSSVGKYVDLFEERLASYTNIDYAIATVNGTAALHTALKLAGVNNGDAVITQSLSFVATTNAILYCEANPIFLDIDINTLGLSHDSLKYFLETSCELRNDGYCWDKKNNRIIRACLPMHTFGFPVEIDKIKLLTKKYNIVLIEDAAEALGSFYKDQHIGIVGDIAVLSFNGNKIITTGGGGMVLTNDADIAHRAKHITTTAKIKHKWKFDHDEVAYNYRLPNINAALGLSQLEQLDSFIKNKREIASLYQKWGFENGIEFFYEPKDSKSNYWLSVLLAKNKPTK